jgi:tetratricopeptide (TPR) repeat protein
MSKAVMDQDGDLEALYETKAWKDAQLVGSQSLYFLNWLRYVGAFVVDAAKRKDLLQKAADGFSEFAVGEQGTQLKREALFGRALAEKELRQFDWAIRDFELLLKDAGLPADMERKVRASLADAKNRKAKGGGETREEAGAPPPPPSEEDIAKAMIQKAQSLFARSKKETGAAREKTRWEAISYLEEARKKGETGKVRADAVAKAEMTTEETLALEAERNPFPPWKEASEYLRKNDYANAIPRLQEVIASQDPRAMVYRRDAQYFLGVGLFQQRAYNEAAAQLYAFLNADGAPPRYGAEAAYIRFKAAEALFSRSNTEENTKLYIATIKDYIRRYPNHKSVFEAYFRLGEYEQSHENYQAAIDAYQKVSGDPAFRVRADFALLQMYSAMLEAIEQKKPVPFSENEIRQRMASLFPSFWKNSTAIEKNPGDVPLRDYRGKVAFMNAVFLSKDMDANATTLIPLLQDFEKKYPEQKDAFETLARARLVALEKAGRFEEIEKEVDDIFARYTPEQRKELFKALPEVLVRDIRNLENENKPEAVLAAKRTLTKLYADRLSRGEAFAADESPDKFRYELAQLYLDVKEYDKAIALYDELAQESGAYKIASLGGLAQIAALQGDAQKSSPYWNRMLEGTQVGDPLWFRGTYETAQISADSGNKEQACKIVSSAFVMINRLGEPGLKKKIQDLSVQTCRKSS